MEGENQTEGIQLFSVGKETDNTATFLGSPDDKTLTTPKRDSDTKSPTKHLTGSKSPDKTTEFNLKETNSSEDDQYALVQVPKPLEPFDHKNDLDDEED